MHGCKRWRTTPPRAVRRATDRGPPVPAHHGAAAQARADGSAQPAGPRQRSQSTLRRLAPPARSGRPPPPRGREAAPRPPPAARRRSPGPEAARWIAAVSPEGLTDHGSTRSMAQGGMNRRLLSVPVGPLIRSGLFQVACRFLQNSNWVPRRRKGIRAVQSLVSSMTFYFILGAALKDPRPALRGP